MMFRTSAALACSWLFATALLLFSAVETVDAKTAVLFGATGAVGNEILKALVVDEDDRFFTEVILVGRRDFPLKVTEVLPPSSELPKIVTLVIPDLENIDSHEGLAQLTADACFVAVGAAFPHLSDYHDWYSVDVTMASSMVRACGAMGVASVSVFSSIDAEAAPAPPTEDALAQTGAPLGWWPVLAGTTHMMGLKEGAVVAAAADAVPAVRIFQPCNIVTRDTRYGWLDWTLFKVLPLLDPWLPTRYHSVTTELLARAIVGDAVNVLSERGTSVGTLGDDGATRFTYGDFLAIAGEEDGRHMEL